METINTFTRSHSNLFWPSLNDEWKNKKYNQTLLRAAKLTFKSAAETVLKDVAVDLLSHMTEPT